MALKCNPNDLSAKVNQELHLHKADKVRQNLRDMKSAATAENLVITFELQKTLICPVLTCSVAYYKR